MPYVEDSDSLNDEGFGYLSKINFLKLPYFSDIIPYVPGAPLTEVNGHISKTRKDTALKKKTNC